MDEYLSLDRNKLNKLNKYGIPRVDSWSSLIKKSNLNNDVFLKTYSLASNYAHSEYLSILQISQSNMNSQSYENNGSINLCLNMTKMINSLCVEYYTTRHESAQLAYDQFSLDIKNSIHLWASMGKKSS